MSSPVRGTVYTYFVETVTRISKETFLKGNSIS